MPKIYDIDMILLSSFSWLSILIELSNGKEMSGYDILDHVNNFGFPVSSGTVYHQLEMLETAGLIKPKPVRRGRSYKTVYEMTDKGMKAFQKFKKKWKKPLGYAYKNLNT